jgi:phosphatidylserine/phosphatidylglycerophosphate/cardiolipin synthase-like enzyme
MSHAEHVSKTSRRRWHRPLPPGLSYTGGVHAATTVEFLADKTWVDDVGVRRSEQAIFDTAFDMIERSRRLLLLDLFLYNDFQGRHPERTRPLSGELTDLLVRHKQANPELRVVLITDPINTVYGSVPSAQFDRLRHAGIEVVLTNLRKLRDPNPLYSLMWRLLVRPFGNSARGWMRSPVGGSHKVTARSYLEAFNFKANHRKTIIADCGDDWQALVTSANPHDASSAHTNIAIRFGGQAVRDLLASENAVMRLSGSDAVEVTVDTPPQAEGATVQILTESAIKAAALRMIDGARRNERLSVSTFYLSERDVVTALKGAQHRGVALRLLLDPNKDAFGNPKFGIPNRQVACELAGIGVEIRWAHTHGEQCHTKMMLRESMSGEAELLAGSANLTRRNLDDFNLETSVLVRTDASARVFRDAKFHFDLLWYGQPGRIFSVPYEHYQENSALKRGLYRFMEASGFSTW